MIRYDFWYQEKEGKKMLWHYSLDDPRQPWPLRIKPLTREIIVATTAPRCYDFTRSAADLTLAYKIITDHVYSVLAYSTKEDVWPTNMQDFWYILGTQNSGVKKSPYFRRTLTDYQSCLSWLELGADDA